MTAAELVDSAATDRVLVLGSPPPEGRDLDIVASPDQRAVIEAALASHGYVERGGQWARFADCSADVVDFISLGLPRLEEEWLLASARDLPGYARLAVPSPGGDLLVLALMLKWGGWKESRRGRLERASTEEAWLEAGRHAGTWGVAAELSQLRTGRLAVRRPAPRRPRVIALSGIDGSGKSTQARALRETLALLGYDAAIAWTPLSQNAWLGALATPIKAILRRGGPMSPAEDTPQTGLHHDGGTELRSRNRLVFFAWTTLVALANGMFHQRESLRHAAAGRVVIFDRYVLDTAAQWGFRYGEGRSYAFQNFIVRLLSPPPIAAFYLDLPAEVSLARKPDDRWTEDELRTQARLYREVAERFPVTRLDGRRDAAALCAEIAEAAWRALAR